MKKLVLAIGLITIVLVITAFSSHKERERVYSIQSDTVMTVDEFVDDDSNYLPGYGKSFLGFKEAIGFKESQGRYTIVNTLGYLGKYQFGKSTLATLRITNVNYFLYNSKLQEKAFKANCAYNKYLLRNEIQEHVGTTIKGIAITESGIIAAAHLSGAGSVKRYLRTKGKGKRIVDAYGTNIEQYLTKFAGYDISFIKPTKYPTLK